MPPTPVLFVVEGGVARHLHDAVDTDGLGEPVIEFLAAFDLCRTVLVAARFDVELGGGSIRMSMSSENG